MTEKIRRWDTAEHLHSNDEIETYLKSSFADGDEKQILRALDNAARARAKLSRNGDFTEEAKAEVVVAGTWT